MNKYMAEQKENNPYMRARQRYPQTIFLLHLVKKMNHVSSSAPEWKIPQYERNEIVRTTKQFRADLEGIKDIKRY